MCVSQGGRQGREKGGGDSILSQSSPTNCVNVPNYQQLNRYQMINIMKPKNRSSGVTRGSISLQKHGSKSPAGELPVKIKPSLEQEGSQGTPREHEKNKDNEDRMSTYSEQMRLQEAVLLNSTLEEPPWSRLLEDSGGNGLYGDMKGLSEYAKYQNNTIGRGVDEVHRSNRMNNEDEEEEGIHYINKRVVERVRKFFIGRLYKFNYVLLENQAVSLFGYHILLFVEFIQMLFFCFYNFRFLNEFVDPNGSSSSKPTTVSQADTLASDQSNSTTQASHTVEFAIFSVEDQGTDANTFRLDNNFFIIPNFHLYPLKNDQTQGYLVVFIVISAIFYSMLVLLFVTANRLFSAQKNDEIKDLNAYILKSLSLLMAAFLFFMQFPMIQASMQGYLCNEEQSLPVNNFILSNIECGGLQNCIMSGLATLNLLVYVVFLYIQLSIYNTSSLESAIPWASLDKQLPFLKVVWKLLISGFFIIDKANSIRKYTHLISFIVGCYIIFRRLRHTLVTDKSVLYASTFYDMMAAWLFLNVGINELARLTLSIYKLFLTITAGVFITVAAIILSERSRNHSIFDEDTFQEEVNADSASKCLQVIHRLFEIIRSNNSLDSIFINGLIAGHFEDCMNDACPCYDWLPTFDVLVERANFAMDYEIAEENNFWKGEVWREIMAKRAAANAMALNEQMREFKSTRMHGEDDYSQNLSQSNLKITSKDQSSLPQFQTISIVGPHAQKGYGPRTYDGQLHDDQEKPKDQTSTVPLNMIAPNSNKYQSVVQPSPRSQFSHFDTTDKQSNDYLARRFNNEVDPKHHYYEGQLKQVPADAFSGVDNLNQTAPPIESGYVKKAQGDIDDSQRNFETVEATKIKQSSKNRANVESQLAEEIKQFESIFKVNLNAIGNNSNDRFSIHKKKGVRAYLHAANLAKSSKTNNIYETQMTENENTVKISDDQQQQQHSDHKYFFVDDQVLDEAGLSKEELTLKFKFLTTFIEKVIKKFPNFVQFRVHVANIYSQKLENEFKATFQLIKCERELPQTFQTKFCLFRQRLMIEKSVFQKNHTFQDGNSKINVLHFFDYEKMYQRFIKFSYFAANSAINFWRELLKKNIDSQVMIERGTEISKLHTKIKIIYEDMQRISQNDIKFLVQYSTFLWKIVHIEHEAQYLFDKALTLYHRLSEFNGLSEFTNGHQSQAGNGIIGDNSAIAIVIVTLSTDELGRIVHVNEEIERVLGFKRRQLIGKNISWLTPKPISVIHDKFINAFIETSKSTMINQQRENFGMSVDGYLRPIKLMLSLYPQLQDKITLLGYFQAIDRISGIASPDSLEIPEEYLQQNSHHYLMADTFGYLSCISEGLLEVGLNSKFISTAASAYQSIHIEQLFGPDITKHELFEALTGEGLVMQLDTRQVLEHQNVEAILEEEVMYSLLKQGLFNCHVQLKRYTYEQYNSIVDLYKIIVLPADYKKGITGDRRGTQAQDKLPKVRDPNHQQQSIKPQGDSTSPRSNKQLDSNINGANSSSMGGTRGLDISSMSSTDSRSSGSNQTNYSTLIQEFKNVIGATKTPPHLLKLNFFIAFLILLSVLISSVDFNLKMSYLTKESEMTDLLVNSLSRSVKFVLMFQNLRSLINLSNGLEFRTYSDQSLRRIDRFHYLKTLIMKEQDEIFELLAYFSEQRNHFDSQELVDFQNQMITLYRLSSLGEITTEKMHYSIAFDSFMDKISQVNVSSTDNLLLPEYIIRGVPFLNYTSKPFLFDPPLDKDINASNISDVNPFQQDTFFLISNGLRILLTQTNAVEEELRLLVSDLSQQANVANSLAIMISGIFVCLISLGILINKIASIDLNYREILSIYSFLPIQEISRIHDICDSYLYAIDNNTIAPENIQKEIDNIDQIIINTAFSRSHGGPSASGGSGLEKTKNVNINKNFFSYSHKSLSHDNDQHDDNNYQEESKDHEGPMIIGGGCQWQNSAGVKELQDKKMQQKLRAKIVSRKDYYAQMIQKFVLIMKDEENYQLEAFINRQDSIRSRFEKEKTMAKHDETAAKSKDEGGKKGGARASKKEGKKKIAKAMGLKESEDPDCTMRKLNERQMSIRRQKNGHQKDDDEFSNDNEIEGEFDISHNFQRKKENNAKKEELSKLEEEQKQFMQRRSMLKVISDDRRRKCLHKVLAAVILMCIFAAYFAYTYVFHKYQLDDLYNIQLHSLSYFKRFEDMSLQFQFLREKFLNHNTNDTALDFKLPHDAPGQEHINQNVEDYYHDESINGELEIQQQKSGSFMRILAPLIDFSDLLDSKEFCDTVFQQVPYEQAKVKAILNGVSTTQLQTIISDSYLTEITNDIPVIIAVLRNDLQKLQQLRANGAFFNHTDYDKRTPLHVACHSGLVGATQFLLEDPNVNINALDRWGSTPLNDAHNYPEIQKILTKKGGKNGTYFNQFKSAAISMTDNQYRLFYAAYYNDLEMMDALRIIGWNVNMRDRSGRSPLSIAASEGNLDAVKMLLAAGSETNFKDARGDDPLDDAIREGKQEIIDIIVQEASLKDQCNTFQDGIFSKGFSATFAIFNRKYQDLKISLYTAAPNVNILTFLGSARSNTFTNNSSTKSYRERMLELLAESNATSTTTTTSEDTNKLSESIIPEGDFFDRMEDVSLLQHVLQLFFSTQELYLKSVINKQQSILLDTYHQYSKGYTIISEAIFYLFLAMQLIALFVFRIKFIRYLKREVMHSRGLLNLVPERFFKENQEEMEKVIKLITS